jgi:CRISPR/Cas system CMR subunit Cmr6 (Cas7 group RAMP superfamily)
MQTILGGAEMSNKNISYLQTLCRISDEYMDNLLTLTDQEINEEHKAAFGEESKNRVNMIQSMFTRVLSAQKREIAARLISDRQDTKSSHEVLELVKKKYGTLKNFFVEGFLNNASMPSDLTLQYRNMEDVTEEDIELLIEALHEHGDIKIEDD